MPSPFQSLRGRRRREWKREKRAHEAREREASKEREKGKNERAKRVTRERAKRTSIIWSLMILTRGVVTNKDAEFTALFASNTRS